MSRQVEVRAVVRTVDFAPAEREQKFNIARRFRIVRQLFVVMEAQMLCGQTQILKILLAVSLKIVIQIGIRPLFAEGLEFHLLKFNGAEREVTGRNFIAERLTDLTDRKRQLCTHGALYIQEIDIFALRIFGAQINHALAVVCNPAERLKHQIEFADIGKVVLAAVRAGNAVVLDILEHFLFGHAVGMRFGVKIVNQIVGAVAHFALLAV